MKKFLSAFVLSTLSLGIFASHARADLYRGTFEIVDIEKQKLKLKDVKEKQTFTADFIYVPDLNQYRPMVLKERASCTEFSPEGFPISRCQELFSANMNNMIRSISLDQFMNYQDEITPENNVYDSTSDKLSIYNVRGLEGIHIDWSELLQLSDGVRKRAYINLYTDLFTVDLATISDLTLLNGLWGDDTTMTLVLEDINNPDKPRKITIKSILKEVECLQGSCVKPGDPTI